MKKFNIKDLYPHVIAISIFVLVALVFCKPALQGKVLQQSDVSQWKAMYEDQRKYHEETGKNALWTNNMFSGMPAYQISLPGYKAISVYLVQNLLTLGLPNPFHFFLLACICFYILALILGISPYIGIIGALSYAYATYNPIIVSVGHETKMMTIAYIPAFIGSIILIYKKRYLAGVTLTSLFTGLLVGANHPQISYYAFMIAGCMSVWFLVKCILEKEFKHLLLSIGLIMAGIAVGLCFNILTLATTYDYSKASIRGGSVLADKNSNNNKTGLSKDYALSYSFSLAEPMVLMFPRFFGGSSGNLEVQQEKSKAIEALQSMQPELAQQLQSYLQFYWGGITQGTAGPPYSGAIVCFLAILGFCFASNAHRWWMLPAIILACMMSWGLYFESFNVFLLNHLPFYNKFRAPSTIMVIPTFLFAMSAVIGLQQFFSLKDPRELFKRFKTGALITLGIIAFGFLFYLSVDFRNENDQALLKQVSQLSDANQRQVLLPAVNDFLDGLKEDRKSLMLSDLLRSLLFVSLAAGTLWLFYKKHVNSVVTTAVIGILSLIDLLGIDTKYLNEENFQDKVDSEETFIPAAYNTEIAQDTSTYRVLDVTNGIFTAFNGNARNAAFHQMIGGYHPAKLSIYQDLIEKQLYKFPNCQPAINMLNTKYVIFKDPSSGAVSYQVNPNAAGPCWLVDKVEVIKDPAIVMKALDSLDIRNKALAETDPGAAIERVAGDTIILQRNDHDQIYYRANIQKNGFAVFSEVFYDRGWKAYVNGKEAKIIKTNYVLRGLHLPAGNHEIFFEFKPESYYNSKWISMGANYLIWLMLIFTAFHYAKTLLKKRNERT